MSHYADGRLKTPFLLQHQNLALVRVEPDATVQAAGNGSRSQSKFKDITDVISGPLQQPGPTTTVRELPRGVADSIALPTIGRRKNKQAKAQVETTPKSSLEPGGPEHVSRIPAVIEARPTRVLGSQTGMSGSSMRIAQVTQGSTDNQPGPDSTITNNSPSHQDNHNEFEVTRSCRKNGKSKASKKGIRIVAQAVSQPAPSQLMSTLASDPAKNLPGRPKPTDEDTLKTPDPLPVMAPAPRADVLQDSVPQPLTSSARQKKRARRNADAKFRQVEVSEPRRSALRSVGGPHDASLDDASVPMEKNKSSSGRASNPAVKELPLGIPSSLPDVTTTRVETAAPAAPVPPFMQDRSALETGAENRLTSASSLIPNGRSSKVRKPKFDPKPSTNSATVTSVDVRAPPQSVLIVEGDVDGIVSTEKPKRKKKADANANIATVMSRNAETPAPGVKTPGPTDHLLEDVSHIQKTPSNVPQVLYTSSSRVADFASLRRDATPPVPATRLITIAKKERAPGKRKASKLLEHNSVRLEPESNSNVNPTNLTQGITSRSVSAMHTLPLKKRKPNAKVKGGKVADVLPLVAEGHVHQSASVLIDTAEESNACDANSANQSQHPITMPSAQTRKRLAAAAKKALKRDRITEMKCRSSKAGSSRASSQCTPEIMIQPTEQIAVKDTIVSVSHCFTSESIR